MVSSGIWGTKMFNKATNNQALRSAFAPILWLGVSAGSLLLLANIAPSILVSALMIVVVSALIIALVAKGTDVDMPAVPVLGAGLFSLIAWLSVSMMPDVSAVAEMGQGWVLVAKAVVFLTTVLIAMPVLALAETLISAVLVALISRSTGASVLGSELRIVAMINAKFGGLAGSINR